MMIKLKTAGFIASLTFNGLILAVLIVTAAAKPNASSLSFPAVEDGYAAAAAVAIFPAASELVFHPVEIALKPAQKAFLQYSVFAGRGQTNIFVSALYDPQIVAIEYADTGVSITALREGETLMQYIANDGIKDLVKITVAK